jgi:hypothetical protein
MVTGKSPIMPTTWVALGQPPSDASEEVSMVTQFDEEKQHLWEMDKANFERPHKQYKGFCGQVSTKGEF